MISQVSKTSQNTMDIVPPQSVISILGIDDQTIASAAALLRAGFSVICADGDTDKVDMLGQRITLGISTSVMATLRSGQAEGRLAISDDIFAAVMDSDVTFICQGTGIDFLGEDCTYGLEAMGRTIGRAIALKSGFHIVVQQAAALPGLTRRVLIPAIEAASGLEAGIGFGLCHSCDAFASVGSRHADDQRPALVGVTDRLSASFLDGLLGRIGKQALIASIELSEMASQTETIADDAEPAMATAPQPMSLWQDWNLTAAPASMPRGRAAKRIDHAWADLPDNGPLWTHPLAALS